VDKSTDMTIPMCILLLHTGQLTKDKQHKL